MRKKGYYNKQVFNLVTNDIDGTFITNKFHNSYRS